MCECCASSVEDDIGVLAAAAALPIAPQGDELELVLLARSPVDVWPPPRVVWHRLLEIGLQCLQALLGGRVAPRVEAVLVERLAERFDLRLGDLNLGFPDLRKVARGDVPGEQADD